EIDVGGSDDADINLNFVHPAQMHELAVLKDAKNFALGVEAHGADLVEKQGAAIGDFKQALLGGDGAGKRAFDVPEKSGFKQVGRHGAGVHRNERSVFAGGVEV